MDVSATGDLFGSSIYPYTVVYQQGRSFETLVSYPTNKLQDARLPAGDCQYSSSVKEADTDSLRSDTYGPVDSTGNIPLPRLITIVRDDAPLPFQTGSVTRKRRAYQHRRWQQVVASGQPLDQLDFLEWKQAKEGACELDKCPTAKPGSFRVSDARRKRVRSLTLCAVRRYPQ